MMAQSRDSAVGVIAPEIQSAKWLNSEPLKIADLLDQKKLILVDFWTYSCINCQRTIPHLKKWWETYKDKGLVIIGIHSPEFDFERTDENVEKALTHLGVSWPVVNDSDHKNWKAYKNRYWPRKYLISPPDGKIVYDHIGEGSYEETESKIQEELQKLGADNLGNIVSISHQHKAGNVCYPSSAETYLGSERGAYKNQSWGKIFTERAYNYKNNEQDHRPGVALNGKWNIGKEFVEHSEKTNSLTDYVSLIFSGLDVNAVLESSNNEECAVMVLLNGRPIPKEKQGSDVREINNKTFVLVKNARMYRIIHGKDQNSGAELRLYSDSDNLRSYVFTFGGCKD